MARQHSKRKYAAVALGIIGVAGLSVASAATLTVNAANEVAIGSDVFSACDTDGVNVGYTYSSASGTYSIQDLEVTSIASACNGEAIEVVLEDAAGNELASGSGVVSSGAYTLDVSGDNIAIATDLGEVTVIIG